MNRDKYLGILSFLRRVSFPEFLDWKKEKRKESNFSSLFAKNSDFDHAILPTLYSRWSIIDSYPPRFFPYNLYTSEEPEGQRDIKSI